jgi:hypothetical protein
MFSDDAMVTALAAFGTGFRLGKGSKRRTEMLFTILIVLLILMLLGAMPTWPHSRSWGYYPSGGLGLVVLILVVLLLMGRI